MGLESDKGLMAVVWVVVWLVVLGMDLGLGNLPFAEVAVCLPGGWERRGTIL